MILRPVHADAIVTATKAYITTVLNPKALIVGLVLLPSPADPRFVPELAVFCVLAMAVALVWGAAGMLTQEAGGNDRRLLILQRIASV